MVGLAPGGITDVTARLYAEAVSAHIGQRILVASGNQRTDLAFAAILMLSLLGILLFTLVALAEKLLCPWYDKS